MVFNEIKSLYDLIEQHSDKKEEKQEEKNLKKLLIYFFKNENDLVGKKELKENTGLNLKIIFEIIKKGKKEEYIKEFNTDWGWNNKEQRKWKLTKDGEFYVESLLEELNNSS